MISIDSRKHSLSLERNGIKAELNFHPTSGMMYKRQLPEYMQFLTKRNYELWRRDDKKLLLIGGASSKIRKWLSEVNVDLEITNIDFYNKMDPDVSHHHVQKDFYDWNVPYNCYDQEWALWSLPAYSLSKSEVEHFFIKSALALSPNGILRVFPINRGPGEMGDSNSTYTNEERKEDSIKILSHLTNLGYSVTQIFPREMENIVDHLEKSNRASDRRIYKLLNETHSSRISYMKEEIANYKRKSIDRTPIAINLTAPKDYMIKQKSNFVLIEYLNNIKQL
ncbi:MAG: hypothetical protein JXR63_02355 [Spirochaetales bacterium]|nr:hypothetical protein [Spirochaetales bacterium]